jgi:hypothetical protein
MPDKTFRNFQHFEKEFLRQRSGPLASAVDEIAEDMYHSQVTEEFDAMWDKADDE